MFGTAKPTRGDRMTYETVAVVVAFGFALYAIVVGAYEFMGEHHHKG